MNFSILAAGAGGLDITTIVMFGLMFGVFWWFILRPQNQKRKALEEERQNVSKGSEIITIGGIHGTVVSVDETTVVIEVQDGTKMKVDKTALTFNGEQQIEPQK